MHFDKMNVVQAGQAAARTATTATVNWIAAAITYRPRLLWSIAQSLPAGGLDALTAQSVLFSLRASLAAEQVSAGDIDGC
jgi:hypothetical protein